MWQQSTYIATNKATQKDQRPYLTELNGHKIGRWYMSPLVQARFQLVMIGKSGDIVLVNEHGVGHTTHIDTLDSLNGHPTGPNTFDWLTWRTYNENKTYKHGPLSNFWLENDGKTLEHRFQALKTTDFNEKWDIMRASTPGQAKRRGRRVALRPDWDEIKRDLLWDLLLKKFEADPWLCQYLVATGDKIIREKNDWNDTIWGVNKQNQGQNLLGMGLMYVRDVLNG